MTVAGVDGCRAGWVVASEGGVEVVSDFSAVLERPFQAVAVDIPIGLPDSGPRCCDLEARRLIGARRSSVFPAPARPLLRARSWADAPGISRQTYGILAKVAEVDAAISPTLQHRVVEAHPEVAFTQLIGRPPTYPKRTPEGRGERLAALETVFACVTIGRLPGTAPDDVLDAYVLYWTAGRFARGEALVLGNGQRDTRGLRMEIVA